MLERLANKGEDDAAARPRGIPWQGVQVDANVVVRRLIDAHVDELRPVDGRAAGAAVQHVDAAEASLVEEVPRV